MSLGVTFNFTIQYLLWSNVLGFSLALLIHKSSLFNNISRTIFFLPFTISVTAGAIVWSYVFTDVYSPLTGNVSPLGLPSQVVPAMAIMAAWRDMGYCMVVYTPRFKPSLRISMRPPPWREQMRGRSLFTLPFP